MAWFRNLCCLAIVAVSATNYAACTELNLERVSKKRFQEAFTEYAKQRGRARFKRGVGCTLLGVGVVGASAWVISSMTNMGNTRTGANVAAPPQNFWQAVRETFKHMAIWSVAGSLILVFRDLWRSGYSSLKKIFLGCPDEIKNALKPYAKRLDVELARLHQSLKELQTYGDNKSLTNFYKQEIVGAFKILVHSLEKFSAILYWHMRKTGQDDEQAIHNLFLFCNCIAQELEADLSGTSFSQTTLDGVASLRRAILFFAGNLP